MPASMLYAIVSPFVAGLAAYAFGSRKLLENKKGKGQGALERSNSVRDVFVILFTISLLAVIVENAYEVMVSGKEIIASVPGICGFGLHFCMDGFRGIYALVASFMWAMVSLLSREYFMHHENTNRFYLFLLWTLGATLGVFLSADLITTFVFFEIMSFTSYVWVAQEESGPALRAASTYLAVAVIGGLVMLMGIFLLYHETGILEVEQLLSIDSTNPIIVVAGICMLVGFGAKAGAFPLHIWLPKAHPVAPAPASALLSGILTKTGIYGVLILSCRLFHYNTFWGRMILALGVLTMFGGALLALFSIDLKRTLACSSMSQIGFILVGIGMQGLLGEENELALHGSMLHMINHSLIKLVLFMVAGVVYQNLHVLDLNQIRGYGRKKPLLKGIFLVGALAIGGIPFFGGYISKTLLHESILEYHGGSLFVAIEWIFLLSGAMTVAYMTKLYVAIFVEKNQDEKLQRKYDQKKPYMNVTSTVALCFSSLVLFVWGFFPKTLMEKAARLGEDFLAADFLEHHQVHYFALENLKGAIISIVLGAVLYFLVIRKLFMKEKQYVNCWPEKLDLEELLYRPVLLKILPVLCGIFCRGFDCILDTMIVVLRKTVYRDSPLPYERSEGTYFTDLLGRIGNRWQSFANKTYHKENPTNKDYVHVWAMRKLGWKESNFIIQRSLSFGLFLFCVGLGLMLIYVILL